MDARSQTISRGRRLEYFTVAYNALEGLVSIVAGLMAGSVSLVGYGLDSAIEMTSGAALLWRLRHDGMDGAERTALRIVGWCFIALGLYVAYESGAALILHKTPDKSVAGIVVAASSAVVMPLLAKAKRRVAGGIGSAAMMADSRQADLCAYLSAILLVGLLLNATLGWWWADPVAGLAMVPIILKEGTDGIRAKACGCHE